MAHEDFTREAEVETSSNRSFGVVFTVVFAIVGLWPLFSGGAVRIWSLLIAGAVVAVTLAAPGWLAAPNRLWTAFGLLLGRLMNPVISGILFFAVFVPFGLAMRLLRKDPLRLKLDRAAATYWIDRDPPGPDPKSMKNQF